jgi:hypothetical protein|uniref:Tetratricopeptide repeat protein n=1 Tax=candidate division WOR-3 bacterium TaxID=2052148 RepID=A0A7V3RH78_UNCW3
MILLIVASLGELVQLYNTGNKLYAEGNFKSAIEYYEKALSLCENKDILYNLGNAYFKSGKIGKAILNYRRAYYLCPRDEDIIYNLYFLRNFRPDKITTMPNPLIQFFDRLFHQFSLAEASALSAILFFVISIFLSLFLITKNKIFIWIDFFGFFFFIYFVITTGIWRGEKNSNPAVVIVSELKAYSGPGDEYKEIFIIHDGAEVKIKEFRNGYYLIQLPGGIGGWVKSEGVEKIYR